MTDERNIERYGTCPAGGGEYPHRWARTSRTVISADGFTVTRVERSVCTFCQIDKADARGGK